MLMSSSDYVARAKATIKEGAVSDMHQSLYSETLLIDVRELQEFKRGHLPGATLAPGGLLEFDIHAIVARTCTNPEIAPEDRHIVVYCGTGGRSALAAKTLNSLGYRKVKSMAGGIVAWAAARLPIDLPS